MAILFQKTESSLFIFFELAIYLVKKKVKKTIFYISLLNSFLLFLPLLLTTHNNAHHYLCIDISFYSFLIAHWMLVLYDSRLETQQLPVACDTSNVPWLHHLTASTMIFSLVSSLESHCFPFTNLLHLFKAFECYNIKHILNIYNSPWYNILDWHPHQDVILLLTRQKWS